VYLKNEDALPARSAPTEKPTGANHSVERQLLQAKAPWPSWAVPKERFERRGNLISWPRADALPEPASSPEERARDREDLLASLRRNLGEAAVEAFRLRWELQDRGVLFDVWAMSWQALKWAAQQQAGDLSANAVLRVYADHADQIGRTWVDSNTIAKELQTSQPTVLNATKRLVESGLLKDTKERSGQTGSVRVFQLKIPRENKRTSSFSASRSKRANKRTRSA
jgi:hypothetical protein